MSNNLTINLEGLLGNDLIFYNRIMTDFYSRILKINTTTDINCNINIDKITLRNSNGCNIEVINKCFVNMKNSLNILLKTLVDNKKYMTENIKKKIEKGLNINLDINIDNQPDLLKQCNLSASVSNDIIVKELFINNCIGTSKFLFYNTGDANTNCGMVEIINAISNKKDQIESKEYEYYLNRFLFFNINDLLTIICIIFIIIVIILIINIILSNTKSFYFISKYFIKKDKQN